MRELPDLLPFPHMTAIPQKDMLIEDLTLLLAYLTSCGVEEEDEVYAEKALSSQVLETLADEGLIREENETSVAITQAGQERAEDLLEVLGNLVETFNEVNPEEADGSVEDFLFDDCEICKAQKNALEEHRNIGLTELTEAFKRAEKAQKGAAKKKG